MKQVQYCLILFALLIATVRPIYPQATASRLITKPVDETKLITLYGNVHPLAQARYDHGVVPDAMPAQRILLLLNRPPEREAALQKFLRDVHTRGSVRYHQWVTPERFGAQFGPADADIEAATGWLRTQGFDVTRVAKSRQFIEFSGTAGRLRRAFHTEIHQYDINGTTHYANASEISIPASLAPMVRGVSPLNSLHAQPHIRIAGPALYSRMTKKATPLWTIPNLFGTANPYAYPVAPEDLAMQYDLGPLYQAGTNGSGETIGIINSSNVDLSMVNAYQQLFGMANNPTQIVIDGGDPGIVQGADTEAYLDVEVSGAMAPGATVNLYISDGNVLQDPLVLAAIRAVEDNQASVLSASFGQCEANLGNAGNQFWFLLWEQAAAQGQTVFVSSGDSGPYCNYGPSISVSGLASTPWNIAVGGTDFYYSDYATGGASATTLWNQTNDSNLGSLIAPLPEQVWDDGFGLDVISNGMQRGEIYSGGGGPSSCSTQSATTGDCAGGYPKPSWQVGPGTQTDSVRDIPDVSLFASNGANLSAYPICAYPGECAAGAGEVEVLMTGGTSASSPAMAGIMALVDQKYGRQGQADVVFYPVAQQTPTAFHDITLGGNYFPCNQGSANCALNANGYFGSTVDAAGPGYDLATGLGSVDANVLVENWNAITLLPTKTSLTLSSTKITHGTAVTVTTSVAPASGSGVPTGGVAITTTSPLPASQGQTALTLNGGTSTQSVNFFPGGYYYVFADYHGDAIFGASSSSPVALTVSPENSNITFSFLDRGTAITNGGTVQYNDPLSLIVQPVGVSAPKGMTNGNATGSAKFTVDSTSAVVALSSSGVANWTPPALSVGSHTAGATYSGDASFNSSSATPVAFSVAKGQPWVRMYFDVPEPPPYPTLNINTGGSLTVTVVVGPLYGGFATGSQAPPGTVTPTGTVTLCLGPDYNVPCQNATYSLTTTLSPASGTNSQYASGSVTFTNLAAGEYFPSAVYSGDATWASQGTLEILTVNVYSITPLLETTTTLNITPSNISGSQLATFSGALTGAGNLGTAPTGTIDFYDNGVFIAYIVLPFANPGTTDPYSFVMNSSSFWTSGSNQITAIYDGDSNYQPSVSSVVNLGVTQNGGDFTLAPQLPQITLKAGGAGSVDLNLSSLNNFNGAVTLTCEPSSSQITCGVNPATPTLNGSVTATLSINATAQAAAASAQSANRGTLWLSAGGGLMVVSFVLRGLTDRKRRRSVLLALVVLVGVSIAPGCGSGSNQSNPPPPPPPPPPNSHIYSVLVTATANGIIHNAKVTVVVQ